MESVRWPAALDPAVAAFGGLAALLRLRACSRALHARHARARGDLWRAARPLEVASVLFTDSVPCARMLAEIYAVDERGAQRALQWACANGHGALARWLVSRGAPTFSVPLRRAIENGHGGIVRWLFTLTGVAGRAHELLDDCLECGRAATLRWIGWRLRPTAGDWGDANEPNVLDDVFDDAVDYAFRSACHRGDLAAARWVVGRLSGPRARRLGAVAHRPTCGFGHTSTARWIVRRTAPAQQDVRGTVLRCGDTGRTATARWTVAYYGYAPPRDERWYLLQVTCTAGRTATAQWIIDHFVLDLRTAPGAVLCYACARGHTETAQWVTSRFRLILADVRGFCREALREACRAGHLATAQWLAEHFGLTLDDARVGNNDALHMAYYGGHFAVAEWLVGHFKFTRDEVRNAVNYAPVGKLYFNAARHLIELAKPTFDT